MHTPPPPVRPSQANANAEANAEAEAAHTASIQPAVRTGEHQVTFAGLGRK
jgi:hypothetical protein